MKEQKQKPDIKKRTINSPKNTTQLIRIKDNREESKKMAATIQMVNNSMQKSATVIQRGGGFSKCCSSETKKEDEKEIRFDTKKDEEVKYNPLIEEEEEKKQEFNPIINEKEQKKSPYENKEEFVLAENFVLRNIENTNNLFHLNTILTDEKNVSFQEDSRFWNSFDKKLEELVKETDVKDCFYILTDLNYHSIIKQKLLTLKKEDLIKYCTDLIETKIPEKSQPSKSEMQELANKLLISLSNNNINLKLDILFKLYDSYDAKNNTDIYYKIINNPKAMSMYNLNPCENPDYNLNKQFHELYKIKGAQYAFDLTHCFDPNKFTEKELKQNLLNHKIFHYNYMHIPINTDINITNRIAANIKPDKLNETASKLHEEFIKDPQKKGYKNFINKFKVSTPFYAETKPDTIIIYFKEIITGGITSTSEIVKTLKSIIGGDFNDTLPIFIKELSNGIGYGSEPEKGSFTDKRAGLAEIAHRIGSTPEESTSILSALFSMSGIDPKKPCEDTHQYKTDVLKDVIANLKENRKY